MTEHSVTITLPKECHRYADTAWSAISDYLRKDGYHWMADSIEEQVKPAIDEPQEFGSIVRASYANSDRMLWQRDPHNRHYWESETGTVEVWSELTDVEVLRVGVGDQRTEGFCTCYPNERALDCGIGEHRREARIRLDPMDDAPENDLDPDCECEQTAYAKGATDTATRIQIRLRALAAEAITAEQQNAFMKAFEAVGEEA